MYIFNSNNIGVDIVISVLKNNIKNNNVKKSGEMWILKLDWNPSQMELFYSKFNILTVMMNLFDLKIIKEIIKINKIYINKNNLY